MKSRIIYVPLEHIDGRYTTHMDRDITNYLNEKDIPFVKVMPKCGLNPPPPARGMFLNAGFTSKFKSLQLATIADMYANGEIRNEDTFFFSDLWFPGIETIAYMNHFYKIKPNLTGVLHAGSFTDTDEVRGLERWAKNFEDIVFDIADTIFVGSYFIKQDVIKKRMIDDRKLVVSGLPLDFEGLDKYKNESLAKENIVVFNGRDHIEKQPHLFKKLAKELEGKAEFIATYEHKYTKDEYYDLLSRAKVVVSFALQENFGYGIAEADYLGCIPVVPNRLAYTELYPYDCLYSTFDDAVHIVNCALGGTMRIRHGISNNNEQCFKSWFGE